MPAPLRLVLASALVLGACSDPAPAPAAPPGPSGAVAEPDSRPAVEARPGASLDRILAIHDNDGDFLAGLRPPRAVRAEPVENEHVAGQIDTVRTRLYDGLSISTYEVTDGPTFIQSVTVSGEGYGTRNGLSPGESRDALEAILGAPIRGAEGARRGQGGAVVLYETDSGPAPTTVEVVYEPDAAGVERASEITWRPYLD